MTAAVVQDSDNVVVNLVVVNEYSQPPEGCYFINIDNINCNIGWVYDVQNKTFYDPNPPPANDGGEQE